MPSATKPAAKAGAQRVQDIYPFAMSSRNPKFLRAVGIVLWAMLLLSVAYVLPFFRSASSRL